MADFLIRLGIVLIVAALLLGPGLNGLRKLLKRMFRS